MSTHLFPMWKAGLIKTIRHDIKRLAAEAYQKINMFLMGESKIAYAAAGLSPAPARPES